MNKSMRRMRAKGSAAAEAATVLVRAMAASVVEARRRTLEAYTNDVSKQPYAQQWHWLSSEAVQLAMGEEWCVERQNRLLKIAERLKRVVPSGAWYDAIWRGQEKFFADETIDCPLAVVGALYGMAARGEITQGRLGKYLAKVRGDRRGRNAWDMLLVLAHACSRMGVSKQRTGFGVEQYVDKKPIGMHPTRRLTPRQSVGHGDGQEDKYDRMSSTYAMFAKDPPSCSARSIIQIGELRGRDQTELDRRKAKRRRKRQEQIDAAKARHGVKD